MECCDECDLLDARCSLPRIENLVEQYDSIADLINDGTNLGYALAECGQGAPRFTEKFIAALALEGCHDLRLALDISQNLTCYDWMACGDLENSARNHLIDAGISEERICTWGVDLRAYQAHLLEKQGYTLSADGQGYIARNSQKFHYQFSTPTHVGIEGGAMNNFEYLLALPGEDQERNWLRERLETLSVREGIVLAAAVQRTQPKDMEQAINCLQSLDKYNMRLDVGSYEALGLTFLANDTYMPKDIIPFADLAAAGRRYEEWHPGLFVGDCYIEYPQEAITPVYHRYWPLPGDNKWSVKLKLASAAVPDGVWLRLPGQEPFGDESTTEEALVLRELRTKHWSECDLLDARCVLPRIDNLMEQYDSVADLIYDGTTLGYVLTEYHQDSPNFIEKFNAALALEDCHDLRLALDISKNLHCYDWVACGDLEASAMRLLLNAGISKELICTCGVDLKGYKAYLLERDGYTLTPERTGYIVRNSQEFHYQYSTPTPEQSGMMMQ